MDACVSVCARVCVHTCAWVGWQWTLCHRILMMIIMSLGRDCPLNFARIQGPPCCCGVVLIRDSIQMRVRDHCVQDQIAFGSGTESICVCASVTVCMSTLKSKTKSHLGSGSNRSLIRDPIAFRFGTSVCVRV